LQQDESSLIGDQHNGLLLEDILNDQDHDVISLSHLPLQEGEIFLEELNTLGLQGSSSVMTTPALYETGKFQQIPKFTFEDENVTL
jgi:hypothetical protein